MSNKVVTSNMDFLAATKADGLDALVGGLKLFKPAEGLEQEKGDKIEKIKTCCKACISNCGVIATVKNGRVIKLEGNPEDRMSRGRLCAKGLAGIQSLYHPNRNKYPMMRVGKRGDNKWRRISWEKAIDIIAHKLLDAKKEHGAESLMVSTGGGGNPEIFSISRFCSIFGTPTWFEPGCAQCYLPRMLSYTMMYGGNDPSIADTQAMEIYKTEDPKIKTLVMWGTAPSYSSPASGGGTVVELRSKGVQTVVIDPRFTPDAARAQVWLPIQPGTDVALQLCWIRYIIEKELFDKEFVMKWTNLPYLVNVETKMLWRHEESTDPDVPDTFMVFDKKTDTAQPLAYPWNDNLDPELDGTYVIDGVLYKTGFALLREQAEDYTLEHAGEICGLEPARIEKAIRLYADNSPSGISIGVATDQGINSVQAAMGAGVIDLLMANVERPGSLLQRFKISPVRDAPLSPCFDKLDPKQMVKRIGNVEHKGLNLWAASHIPSLFDAILTDKPHRPRIWIDRSGNKMAAVADANKVRKVIDEMEFIVHMYMYPTSFSAYADLLLPTQEWLETDMPVPSCDKLWVRQQVAHVWETMDETMIWSKIAKRCAQLGDEDCKKGFDAEYMGDDLPYWDSMSELWDQYLAKVDMTFEDLKANAPYEFATLEEWSNYYLYLIEDENGVPAGFPTPSKKCELYLESMITLGRTGKPFMPIELPPASKDYSPLPYYAVPNESPTKATELFKDYPLVMTGGRVPFYHHNTQRNIPWLREIYPVPEIWMFPTDAEKHGVADGDWAWVSTKRGKIRGVVSVTQGIKPGVVYMERFWNPETLDTETHGWKEMNINVITSSEGPYNDVAGTYTLRGFLVNVTPAEGPPEGIWKNPKDFVAWLAKPSDSTEEVNVLP